MYLAWKLSADKPGRCLGYLVAFSIMRDKTKDLINFSLGCAY